MEKKLKTIPLLTQLPLGHGKDLRGVLDLLSMDLLVWDKDSEGSVFARIPLVTRDSETSEKDFENISLEVLDSELKSAGLFLSIDEALEARYQLAEQVFASLCNKIIVNAARSVYFSLITYMCVFSNLMRLHYKSLYSLVSL